MSGFRTEARTEEDITVPIETVTKTDMTTREMNETS